MKKEIILFFAILLTGSSAIFANQSSKTEKFKVYGNCGMCETRIKKAAKSVDGVISAEWDKNSGLLQVVTVNNKTDIGKIHLAIAKAGHDTDRQKATDESYNKLHGCCKYERKSDAVMNHVTPESSQSGCTRNSNSNSCCP
jgi:periplasmic mercuric ion binding protein